MREPDAATERDLRDGLAASAAGPQAPEFDVEGIAARAESARRSRRSAYLGGAAAVVLAVGGLGTWLGAAGGFGGGAVSTADAPVAQDSGAESGAADGGLSPDASGLIRLAPPDKVNGCGGPIAAATTVSEDPDGPPRLTAVVSFPAEAAAGSEQIAGSVVVTNTSDARVTGSTQAYPAMTIADGGITAWHTNGPMIELARIIDLAPGESTTLEASVVPVRCGEEDEANGFREDLPALPAGSYELQAVVPIYAADGSAPLYLVTVPAPITLR